jgi:Transposase
MPVLRVGIDSGKRAHHCVVIDQTGAVLLSKRVENDENGLLELIATVAIASNQSRAWTRSAWTFGSSPPAVRI